MVIGGGRQLAHPSPGHSPLLPLLFFLQFKRDVLRTIEELIGFCTAVLPPMRHSQAMVCLPSVN